MTITVDGVALANVFNVQYQKAIAELGQGGISISSLSFDVIAPFYASTAAVVVCDAVTGITFYVNNRTKNGHAYHVECLDAAAFLDQEIELTDSDISKQGHNGYFVTAAVIQSKISAKCKGLTAAIPWVPTQYGFPLDYVKEKTFQQILTDISEVCAGFYTISANGLDFRYLNESDATPSRPHHSITYHSAVNVNGSFEYTAIDVVSSYETAVIGTPQAADFNTLTISNALSDYLFPVYDATRTNPDTGTVEHYTHVDTSITPAELGGIVQRTFDGWTCDSVILTGIPALGDYADFQTGEELHITDISIRFIGNTMLASLGGGIPSSGEIGRRSRRQQELDDKLTIGQVCGNVATNRYGQKYLEQAPTQSSGGGS